MDSHLAEFGSLLEHLVYLLTKFILLVSIAPVALFLYRRTSYFINSIRYYSNRYYFLQRYNNNLNLQTKTKNHSRIFHISDSGEDTKRTVNTLHTFDNLNLSTSSFILSSSSSIDFCQVYSSKF